MACMHIKGVTCSECYNDAPTTVVGSAMSWTYPIIEKPVISRRDLFLAAALNGLISNYGGHTLDAHEAAKIAVAFADSLLKEAADGV